MPKRVWFRGKALTQRFHQDICVFFSDKLSGQCGDVSIGREQAEQRPACGKGVQVPAEVSLVVKTVCPLRKSFTLLSLK